MGSMGASGPFHGQARVDLMEIVTRARQAAGAGLAGTCGDSVMFLCEIVQQFVDAKVSIGDGELDRILAIHGVRVGQEERPRLMDSLRALLAGKVVAVQQAPDGFVPKVPATKAGLSGTMNRVWQAAERSFTASDRTALSVVLQELAARLEADQRARLAMRDELMAGLDDLERRMGN